jgi:glucan endo-1,3-alpha-glucosidase
MALVTSIRNLSEVEKMTQPLFYVALNIAENDYEVARIDDAFTAAEAAGFKLFFSFDMSYTWDASDIVSITSSHANSSSMYRWNDKVLLSTYSGESYGDSFWSGVKSSLAGAGVNVVFAPAFTSYRDPSDADSLLSNFASIDGFFNWWSW